MSTKKDFELFLYKHNFDQTFLIHLLPKLSHNTIQLLKNDLQKIHNSNSNSNTLTESNTESSPQTNKIYIFTDGGCKLNGKQNAKAAYSIFFTDNQESPYFSFNTTNLITSDTQPTNQKAELLAILHTFKIISEENNKSNLFVNKEIIIYTDSMYAINCIDKWSKNWLQNNWKNTKGEQVKNKEIINEILTLKQNINYKFYHIFSHTSPPTDNTSFDYFLWHGNNTVDTNIHKLLNH